MTSPQREQMMNEEPTPRKSDMMETNRRNSLSTSNNNQGGKTFDLRKSSDATNPAGRQVVIYEPNR